MQNNQAPALSQSRGLTTFLTIDNPMAPGGSGCKHCGKHLLSLAYSLNFLTLAPFLNI